MLIELRELLEDELLLVLIDEELLLLELLVLIELLVDEKLEPLESETISSSSAVPRGPQK